MLSDGKRSGVKHNIKQYKKEVAMSKKESEIANHFIKNSYVIVEDEHVKFLNLILDHQQYRYFRRVKIGEKTFYYDASFELSDLQINMRMLKDFGFEKTVTNKFRDTNKIMFKNYLLLVKRGWIELRLENVKV